MAKKIASRDLTLSKMLFLLQDVVLSLWAAMPIKVPGLILSLRLISFHVF